MNVTNLINKILTDYANTNLVVNSSVKYSFLYNDCQTDVFYTRMDELQNQLLIAVTVNGVDYLSTLNFSMNSDNEYFMNYYLPSELYKNVKFTLLYINGKCSTTPYFERMVQTIMNNKPTPSNHRNDISHKNLYHYHKHNDNPFFETIILKSMSDDMVNKIKNKYDSKVAQQIFKYCGHTKTLRFTSDINKSKDILTFIN